VKELRFPKEMTIRFQLDRGVPRISSFGPPASDDAAVIEKNGSELITATVMLEDRMIEAVSALMFGKGPSREVPRQFFIDEIMGTSDFSFAFKRRVFTRLLERTEKLDSASIKALKAGLNNVMEWRNAFAHGKVVLEFTGGFVLQYYSGGMKELALDDAFFEKVESTVRSCLYICNGVIQNA
jgi:hypothetical protein